MIACFGTGAAIGSLLTLAIGDRAIWIAAALLGLGLPMVRDRVGRQPGPAASE